MYFFDSEIPLKELENNLYYLNNIYNCKQLSYEMISILLESIDYCNRLGIYEKKLEITKIIANLEDVIDIGVEMAINKPYLYIDNDTYSSREYFTGKLKKELINLNKNFSYRYQYDKYLKNNIDYTLNKDNVDYIIRTYKNIILNTTNENLINKCLDMIYEIYKNNPYKDLIGTKYIELIEKEYIEDTKDLVSIILLSYNNDDYVEDTIRSIFEQNYNNIELIIADDCSKNLDIEYFKSIVNKYENNNIKRIIIYKSKINLGIVSNCNKALCLSSGNYIKFIASDDLFYDSNSISNFVYYIKKYDCEVLNSRMQFNDYNMNEIPENQLSETFRYKSFLKRMKIISDKKLFLEYIIKRGGGLGTPSFFYAKIVFDKYGYFCEEYLLFEDEPYYLKLALNECKFQCADFISVKYRVGGGVSTGINFDFIKDKHRFIDKINELKESLLSKQSKIN